MPGRAIATKARPEQGANHIPEPRREARPGAEARNRAGLHLIAASVRRSRRAVVSLSVWSLLSAAPTLVSGKVLAEAVDHGFLAHNPAAAARWLGVFAAVTLAGAWAQRQTYPSLSGIVEPMRDSLLRSVVTGTLHRAARSNAPRTNSAAIAVSQITRQVEAVRDSASGQLMIAWQFVLTAVAVMLGAAALAPAAVPLIALPLVAAVCLFVTLLPMMIRRQRTAFLAEEQLARVSVDALESLRDLISCGAEQQGVDRGLRAARAQAAAARSLAWVAALRRLIVALGAHVPIVLVLLASPTLVRHGMTAGGIVGVLTYLVGVLEPALRLLVQGLGGSFLRLNVAAERLAEAARLPAAPPAPEHSILLKRRPVEVRHVTFAYGPGAEPVLRDLSLVVAPGEHLAVVGPSGIGKSTLAGILAGVIAPDDGSVLIGGVPLPRIAPDVLHQARVLLPQEAYVFAGELRENLRYLAEDCSDQTLLKAADRLGLTALLTRLGGLDAPVDPARLSAGERQLIALTRAYVSPADVVILDEATSHLDASAEARAEAAFHSRPGTVITIAHRISSALRADRILLLDGTRAHLGTHADLVETSPMYANLVALF
ncbi:ATP-binding cassette domain-containing protein [Actinospica robiniae]|uniref:ATP-binding cassette domain-containing protein n=1 Tax=Actinospica robiniae TaxID=304901 RepID=UPI000412225A|nr:ABC transporter ATP-binding protein [Actinospica robiniae]